MSNAEPIVIVDRCSWRLPVSLFAGVTLAVACGGTESAEANSAEVGSGGAKRPSESGSGSSTPEATGADDIIAEPGASAGSDANGGDPSALSEDNACEAVSSKAEVIRRPIDVIVVIDNSGSMEDEIDSVERNINVNFAKILDDSGVDYRVLMLSGYRAGSQIIERSFRVCIEPPLGPSACASRTADDSPHNGDRFFHFDQPIGSTDGPCLMLKTAKGPPVARGSKESGRPTRADDPESQAGWTAHLRPESEKAFIMISDDTVECEIGELELEDNENAADFDESLRATAPELFGATAKERKYSWHSIVGLEENTPADAVYEPTDSLVSDRCESAEDPGEPHQALSRLTGGLRYPVCAVASYDAVFRRIATEIVDGASLPCSWEIPEVPAGKVFDKDKVNLAYLPGDGGAAPELVRVDAAADCSATPAWYYDDLSKPTTIHACPAACETFTEDASGQVDLLFGCETKPHAPATVK